MFKVCIFQSASISIHLATSLEILNNERENNKFFLGVYGIQFT